MSSVHDLEKWKHDTLLELKSILGSIGVHKVDVDVDTLRRIATRIVIEHNWSPKRLIDLMHVLAAKRLGCFAIAALDRFISRRVKEYGLHYINHYTGCP